MFLLNSLCVRSIPPLAKWFGKRHVIALVAIILGISFQAFGQEATMVGTVTDPSGSVIAKAKITAKNAETGLVHSITTNEAGQYVLPDIHIGHYDVKAEATGFKAAEQKGIVLQVGDRARVDFQMQVGASSETITVEATPIRVQTDTGEVSNLITDQQLSQISTNGRSIYVLAGLTAGASSNITGLLNVPVGGDSNVSFNGLRSAHNIYLLDGGEDLDRGGSGNMSIAPSSDAIAEFRALTSNYSAEYGLSSAGTMTMVLKSGSSSLHASAWEFNREDGFDARDFFHPAPSTKTKLRMNIFGFNVGGPVTLGHLYNPDKKRTFFFYNMEWRKYIIGAGSNQTVPDPATYGGDFSSLTSHNIIVPSSSRVAPSVLFANCPGGTAPPGITQGSAFPGNKIPSCMVNPNATALLGAGMFPSTGLANVSDGVGTFRGGSGVPTDLKEEVVRIDHNLTRIPNISLDGQSGANFQISSWPWKNKADDYQIRDDVSWAKGAHQFRFGGSWAIYKKVQDLFGTTQGAFSFSGKAPSYTGDSFADYLLGLPQSYQELGVQDHGYWNNVSWAAYVQDNWRATHRLTLNLGLRWDGAPHTYEANNRMGNFYPSLYDRAMAATFTGSQHGNTICGPTDSAATGCPGGASPGLGSSPNAILAGVPLYLNGIGIPGQNGVHKGLVDNHWASFGPRLGFAYDLNGRGKTVVRGGFGIMYERIQGNDMYNAGPNIPFSLNVTLNNTTFTNPSLEINTGTAATRPINPASITGLDRADYKNPASYQYSLGVQRSLSSKTVLSVAYVGNTNRHQNDYRNINLPTQSALPSLIGTPYQIATGLTYPGFTQMTMSENEANSHYNALQVDLNSQIKDLQLRVLYTYSRTIDSSTGGSSGDLANVSNPYAGWRFDLGPGGLDRTHTFVTNFIYDIPVFRHSSSRLVNSTLGGWEVSGIVTIESGLPINLSAGTGVSDFLGSGASSRPDLVGTISYPHTPVTCTPTCHQEIQYFANVFAAPAKGTWGNLGHNALRGPGRDNWDMSLFKNFTLSESRGSRFELRLETFNTWNHTQFQNIDTGLGDNRFGQFTSAYNARILQLGGKIYF